MMSSSHAKFEACRPSLRVLLVRGRKLTEHNMLREGTGHGGNVTSTGGVRVVSALRVSSLVGGKLAFTPPGDTGRSPPHPPGQLLWLRCQPFFLVVGSGFAS